MGRVTYLGMFSILCLASERFEWKPEEVAIDKGASWLSYGMWVSSNISWNKTHFSIPFSRFMPDSLHQLGCDFLSFVNSV